MMKSLLILIVALVTLSSVLATVTTNEQWINQDVQRSINLQTQISKSTVAIKAKNNGKDTSIYQLALPQSYKSYSIQAFDDSNIELTVTKVDTINEFSLFEVKLRSVVKSGSIINLKVNINLMNQMKPYPKEISQTESQYVLYENNGYFSTPYKTESQKTTIKVSSAKIESFTKLEPSSKQDSTVTYGPYKDIQGYQLSSVNVHFESNTPFLMLNRLEKIYEVSHWGNLAVETYYYFEHRGAKLKGSFSRLDYQRNPGASASHVQEIKELVPKQAADFYYRDQIGNISTSSYTHHPNHLTFKIVPRFPLFGGWKNEFYTGYNLPTGKFLFTDSETGRYVLNVTMGVAIDNIYVGDHQIRFILPEGATDVKFHLPNLVQPVSSHFEITKTFLDTKGRTVLVIDTKDTSYENTKYLQVSYNLSSFAIFHEVLLVIGAVFAICIFFMIYVRLDFSLIKEKSN